jgi:folate-dependent phosphoribosylglycinamide formyltransferase PurN
MSIIFISGNHPRHKYIAKCLEETGMLKAWVIEQRESFVPEPPVGLNKDLKLVFSRHFKLREEVENNFFTNTSRNINIPFLEVSKQELNSDQTIKFIKNYDPRLVISYGCHKLAENFMTEIGARFWNSHGGLSPDYRGVTTHFWPSYFLEPQMTGITLHETTNFLDGGSIIFQSAAEMVSGDTLHMLAARNVLHYGAEIKQKLIKLDLSDIPRGKVQKKYGKVWMESDWRPEHLHLIYNIYEDSIVDMLLRGEITGRKPNLISEI